MPRFEASTPGPDVSFLDMIDYTTPMAGDINSRARGSGRLNGAPASFAGNITNTNVGAPNTTTIFARQWSGGLTIAAATLRAGQYMSALTRTPWWPMGMDWTGFPISARTRLNLRFRFVMLLQRQVAILGDGRFGCCLNFSVTAGGGLVTEDAATCVGVEVSSKPSVNAGRYTAWWRTTSGGALNAGVDLGVTPDGTFQSFGFQYDSGTRVLAILVAGTPTVVVPDAQVPNPTSHAGNPSQFLGAYQYNGGVAGQQDRWGQARLSVAQVI
jgi:hypothetical protein